MSLIMHRVNSDVEITTLNEAVLNNNVNVNDKLNIKNIIIQTAIVTTVSTTIRKVMELFIKVEKHPIITVEPLEKVDHIDEDNVVDFKDKPITINLEEESSIDLNSIKDQLEYLIQEESELKADYETMKAKATQAEEQALKHPKDVGAQKRAKVLRAKANDLKQAVFLKKNLTKLIDSLVGT